MKATYKKLLMATALLMTCGTAMAQELNSAYFTQDYKFRHDLNPAFSNEQNYVSIPALGNINVRLQGNFGVGDVLFPDATGKYRRTFLHPDVGVEEALSGFNTGDNKVQGDIGLTLLSAGFKGFGGYNTIEINSKTNFGVILPYELFQFAKEAKNGTYNIGDINVRAQSYAEIALGHSHQIGDKLRVGAKVKFLLGVARAEALMQDVVADMPAGGNTWNIQAKAKADVMMKGFTYQSERKEYKKRPGSYEYVNDVDIDGAGIGGFGLGLDLGASYIVMDGLTVSAALTDLGFISWSNDMLAENRQSTFTFDGFKDITIEREGQDEHNSHLLKNQSKNYQDQLADFANLQDQGDQGSATKAIAATARVAAEYKLPMYNKLSFGLLAQHRFNGDFSWTEGRLSANWTPLKWLDGGVNVGINDFTTSAGWILNIHPKAFNFFVGMDHILGKQTKEFIPLSSNASFNMGMNVTF